MESDLVAWKIRELREKRGYSMRELAKRADVSVSFLSSIETAKSSPTLAMLLKILEALDTTAPEFFTTDSPRSLDPVAFASEQMTVIDDGEKYSKFLFPDTRETGCIMTYEEYQPYTRNLEKESHPRDLCIYVLAGELSLEIPLRKPIVVRAGDSAYLKAGTTHVASNRTEEILRMVVVELK
jgi:transcriptional regulator with XRE-family HTH domain